MSSLIGGDGLSGLSKGDLTPKTPQQKVQGKQQTIARAQQYMELTKPEEKRTENALAEKATGVVNRSRSGRQPI